MLMMRDSTECQYSLRTGAGLRDKKLLRGAREDQNDDFQRQIKLGIKEEEEGDFAEKA